MGLIMEPGSSIIQMGRLKQEESSKMVLELGNGSTIMSQAKLNKYQATLSLVRERGNGLNMMKMGK